MSEEFYSLALPSSNRRTTTHPEDEKDDSPQNPEEQLYDSEPEAQTVPVHCVNRIEALAKPKKSCISEPARLKAKKKVVAFGHTTNISQTVEGTSARNTKRTPFVPQRAKSLNSSPNMNNKENKAVVEESKLPIVLKEMPKNQITAASTKAKEDLQKPFLDILRQMFTEQEKKLTERDAKTEKQIGELRQELQDRLQTFETRLATQQPPLQPKSTPMFRVAPNIPCSKLQEAFEVIENEVRKDPNAFAMLRSWYTTISRSQKNNCNLESVQIRRDDVARKYQREDGTITEKLTMERTRSLLRPEYSSPSHQPFLSPSRQPFSIDTENFLNRSGLRPGQAKQDQSTLQSVGISARRGRPNHQVPVYELNDDAYDNYARARERNLPVEESYCEDDFDGDDDAENNSPGVFVEPNEDRRRMFEERARRNMPRL